ncbi:MAG: hypothetical protein K5668_09545 [Lachnospiraceae bacterium]|nr:hypothetical protein [Lachnospiraceae bacterium]
MSIRKTLLMLTLNYIIIFAWMFWFRLEVISALIIFPITMGIAFLDTFFAEGRLSAYLWCGNLLIASIVGILLQAYLYIRATGDSGTAFLRVIIEIPVAVLIIAIVALVSGHEAAKLQKRRFIKKSQNEKHSFFMRGNDGDTDEDDSGEDLDTGRSFRSSMDLSSKEIHQDFDEDLYEDEDILDTEEDNEPRFRVIKKS